MAPDDSNFMCQSHGAVAYLTSSPSQPFFRKWKIFLASTDRTQPSIVTNGQQ
jgi:hypothetical protein